MTTSNINRRTALLGTAAIPAALAPLGLAQAATTPNATDQAWAELQAAKAAYAEQRALYDGFEESLPVGRVPRWEDFEDKDEWVRSCDVRGAERALYPANPHDLDEMRSTPSVNLSTMRRMPISKRRRPR